jgi:hypothetical protein
MKLVRRTPCRPASGPRGPRAWRHDTAARHGGHDHGGHDHGDHGDGLEWEDLMPGDQPRVGHHQHVLEAHRPGDRGREPRHLLDVHAGR